MCRHILAVLAALAAFVVLALPDGVAVVGAAPTPAADPTAFDRVWSRTDLPVAQTRVSRTWFWGPAPLAGPFYERYLDSPNDERQVVYYDKGRMEINDPSGDPTNPWYVTSGLLTRELISGRIQIGNGTFLNVGSGADIPVAGDPDNTFPTYRDFATLIDQGQPDRTGSYAATVLTPDGQQTLASATSDPEAQFVQYVTYNGPSGTTVGYNLPRAFWTFMTESGPIDQGGTLQTATPLFDWLFVLGYPIADPFWVQVRVAGVEQWVLVQPFERRVLTYTPGNPAGWRVEMGNIGQHYARWRYQLARAVSLSGDLNYFAFKPGSTWQYSTTLGIDETWSILGQSRSFSGGSTLMVRQESTWNGRYVTYWGITPSGLTLYGRDQLDTSGHIIDSTVYGPPLEYLPTGPLTMDQSWSTTTTAVSILNQPYQLTLSFKVVARQLVATPAGMFLAWKVTTAASYNANLPPSEVAPSTLWFVPTIGIVQWLDDSFAAQLKSASMVTPNE